MTCRDYAKYDLHIHVPAGATPKDGPSAGVTLVAALASLLTRRRVRSDVAMTGEISLRGRVMRVGGIKEKVLAAARFGIKQVILPEQNRADWSEVPEEVRQKLQGAFHPAHLRTAAAGAAREMKRSRDDVGLLVPVLLSLLLAAPSVCFGQRQSEPRPAPLDPVQAEKEARALVTEMLAARPEQNTTNTGLVRIRDAAGKEREIPVRFEITATPTNWVSVYETLPSAGGPGGLKLTVIHSDEQPNRYELFDPAAAGATNAVAKELTPGPNHDALRRLGFLDRGPGAGVSALAEATIAEERDEARQVLRRAGEHQPGGQSPAATRGWCRGS